MQVYPGRYDPAVLVELWEREKVTFSRCVPIIVQMILGVKADQQLDTQGVKSHLKPFFEKGLLSKWVMPTQVATATEIPKISVGKLDKKRIRQDVAQWQTDASVFLSTL